MAMTGYVDKRCTKRWRSVERRPTIAEETLAAKGKNVTLALRQGQRQAPGRREHVL